MMDARAGAGELGLVHLLIVIDHERDIQRAVGHVARHMTSRVTGTGLTKPENILVELRGALEIFDLERNVNDASHSHSPWAISIPLGMANEVRSTRSPRPRPVRDAIFELFYEPAILNLWTLRPRFSST